MTLGFKEYFDKAKKEPTYFREKILAGVDPTKVTVQLVRELDLVNLTAKTKFLGELKPKLHTIRFDPHNRWKPGRSIQMAYDVRTKNYQQFNKGIPELETCVSVQKIQIKWKEEQSIFSKNPTVRVKVPFVFIDKEQSLVHEKVLMLARNDGFNDTDQFFRWFNKDFTGNLIHWSNLRY